MGHIKNKYQRTITLIVFFVLFYFSPFEYRSDLPFSWPQQIAHLCNRVLSPFFLGNTAWNYFPAAGQQTSTEKLPVKKQLLITPHTIGPILVKPPCGYLEHVSNTRFYSSFPPIYFQGQQRQLNPETINTWICRYIITADRDESYLYFGPPDQSSILISKLKETNTRTYDQNGVYAFKFQCQ